MTLKQKIAWVRVPDYAHFMGFYSGTPKQYKEILSLCQTSSKGDLAEWLVRLAANANGKLQQSWVQSQHPPTQWNLRGGRRSSVE